MSSDATFQVEEWLKGYQGFEAKERELMVMTTQMTARALALQVAGAIPMHTDLAWVDEAVQSVSMESLRKKALMSGENPRNSSTHG